jgi:hypothetical protein
VLNGEAVNAEELKKQRNGVKALGYQLPPLAAGSSAASPSRAASFAPQRL